jgi:internalin A
MAARFNIAHQLPIVPKPVRVPRLPDNKGAKRRVRTNTSLGAGRSQPKLHWYQWTLRSLLILPVFVAISMGYVCIRIQDGKRQRAAADAIERAGGIAVYEATWLGRLLRDDSVVSVTSVRFCDGSGSDAVLEYVKRLGDLQKLDVDGFYVTDNGLANLQGLTQLQSLDISCPEVTDAGLAHVRKLAQLRYLSLSGSAITDLGLTNLNSLTQLRNLDLLGTGITNAGLVHLEGLTQLELLTLNDTRVTGAGLAHLQGLVQLKSLSLSNTDVADDGLVNLARLSQLEALYLRNTKITDAGLAHLQGLYQLKDLDLDGTGVTSRGVKKLRQALPQCKVCWGMRRQEPMRWEGDMSHDDDIATPTSATDQTNKE